MDVEQPKYKFTAQGFLQIKGEKSYIVNESLPKELYDPEQLINEMILLNNRLVRVIKINKYSLKETSPEEPYTFTFAIVVEK